jgi:phenylacetate-CoA ligase
MSFYTFKRRVRRLLSPIPGAFGPDFAEQYRFLQSSQWWDYEGLQAYQNDQLRKLISHCYENVPYYRSLFETRGLTPKDFQTPQDLVKLPLLTKSAIRDNAEALVAKNVPLEDREYHTTGGTSGAPLGLWIEEKSNTRRLAFDWRFHGWLGFRFNDRHAYLRGRSITNMPPGKCWYFDPFQNCILFSSFDMNDANMAIYVEKLRDFKPKFLLGYPSSIEVLARFVLDNGLKPNESAEIQAVVTASETINPYQRKTIASAFAAPVFDMYGSTEQAARFGECAAHQGHHEYAEYGITELINPDKDGIGEVITTSFVNYAMPLLRYRIGDRARRSSAPCSCGRGLPLLDRLQGRVQDMAILRDGTRLPIVAFFFSVHVPEMEQIRKLQFIQEQPGRLQAVVVKGKNYQDGACESMFHRMNENLRVPLEIGVSFAEEIERTKEGKHRFFVQRIPEARVEDRETAAAVN